jgi:flagellin
MPVVINTNSAATIASNNLSASNAMLQKSLNRLSSGSRIVNASDDAGGIAVAQRLTAASKRAGVAAGNISSGLSFLQQQDAVFKTGAKIMERMNELQGLYRDTTKSSDDKALYTVEFDKLKTQFVTAVRDAKYNTLDLAKAPAALAITVDENNAKYTLNDPADQIADSSGYAITDGGNFATVTGTSTLNNTAGASAGNFILKVGTRSDVTIVLAADELMSSVITKINASGAAVNASLSINGRLTLTAKNEGESIILKDATTAAIATALGFTKHDTNAIATAGGGTTNNSLLQIQKIAEARAKNGADQNVLGYYAELATASKMNLESSVSRIMDVDVAAESTQLARWNTLVQAGTAMVAQANGSTQSALALLK